MDGRDTKTVIGNTLQTHRFDGVDAIYPFVFRVRFSDISEKRRQTLIRNRRYTPKMVSKCLLDAPAITQNEPLFKS